MAEMQDTVSTMESTTTDIVSTAASSVESPGNASKASKSTKIPLPNLSHTFSKSHDNLASMLRRKAVHMKARARERAAATQAERPAQAETTPKVGVIPMHKSCSIQSFEKGKSARNFSSRALSVQNICRIPLPISAKGNKALLVPKRSSSAQNMINNGQLSGRPQAPTAVTYNAELLSSFEKEKKSLERRISELIQASESRKAEVEKLKFELKKKTQEASDIVQSLHSQNQQLKEQLHEHGITTAHFTDNDKMLLLEQISSELRSSSDFSHDETLGSHRAASEGGDSMNLNRSMMGRSVGNLSSLTPQNASLLSLDFSSLDRQNSLSVDRGLSDIGLAYLRDRIQQMQETHYSTNEELEATLQELADLQDTVNRLTVDIENMNDEKSIVLESLCARTEKLENARLQIEHLKALLIQDGDNYDRSENERQLMALIKSAQEEREELLMKQAEFSNALMVIENENRELQDIVSALRDRAELEESKSRVFQNDKRTLESQICDMKNEMITNQLEIAKFKTMLENERQKVLKVELEGGASENHGKLEELLMHARSEKDGLEEQLKLANLELAEAKTETMKLKELNSNLSEGLQMAQSNARMQTKKLESQIEEMEVERMQLQRKVDVLEDELCQSQLRSKQATDESKSQAARLHQLEAELTTARKQVDELGDSVQEQKKWFQNEHDEWLQLQKDLQVAVVIANDLKTETEYSMEGVVTENQILKEKVSALMKELNGLRLERDILRQKDLEPSLSRLGLLRQVSNKSPSLSDRFVKQIIASTEDQTKADRPLLSPTLPSNGDCFSRIRDFKSEGITTPAEGVPGGPGNMDNMDGVTCQRLMVPEPAFSSSNSISSDTSTPDIDFETENTGSTNSLGDSSKKPLVGILLNKRQLRTGKFPSENYDKMLLEKTVVTGGTSPSHTTKLDPLASLAKQLGGSKRNALLRWCQNKTASYPGIDITNFSSSWNDGLAFCALLHSYIPDKIPFKELSNQDKMRNFKCAFDAAESIGITTGPDTNVLIVTERPDWQAVFSYVTNIYKHFEVDTKS